MGIKRVPGWFVLLAPLFLLLLLATPHLASAQDPTPEPTPTATPSYLQAVPMSTGSNLLIEKTVSFGDIGVIAAILLLVLVEFLMGFISIPRVLIKK